MLEADYIIDIGPEAGRKGGQVVFAGTPEKMLKSSTLTADYLNGRKTIELPEKRRKGSGKEIVLSGATGPQPPRRDSASAARHSHMRVRSQRIRKIKSCQRHSAARYKQATVSLIAFTATV